MNKLTLFSVIAILGSLTIFGLHELNTRPQAPAAKTIVSTTTPLPVNQAMGQGVVVVQPPASAPVVAYEDTSSSSVRAATHRVDGSYAPPDTDFAKLENADPLGNWSGAAKASPTGNWSGNTNVSPTGNWSGGPTPSATGNWSGGPNVPPLGNWTSTEQTH